LGVVVLAGILFGPPASVAQRATEQNGDALAHASTGKASGASADPADVPAIPAALNPNLVDGRATGLCLTAPARPVPRAPFQDLTSSRAGWVAVIPYAFSRLDDPGVHYDHARQWWGERSEGTIAQIRYARSVGMHIMLKPHIWVLGQGWLGDFDPQSEAGWARWEADYRDYLLHFARLGDSLDVEMLCIGTEARMSVRRRPDFWKGLIADIRAVYDGQLTYAANWDNIKHINFWEDLDFIGVDAYFPLSASEHPSLEELLEAWEAPKAALRRLSERHQRPVLFTEFGYLSVDGSAGRHWELEAKRQSLPYNATAQATAYEALFQSFWTEPWFRGGFVWKWFLEEDAGGEGNRDYTPQNKPALSVLQQWYGRE
jgi:hypothetical protein